MNNVLNIIKNNGLTFEQKINSLAKEAENSICVLDITKKTQEYLEKGIICDLFEGNIPFRPRYIVPDYKKFMRNGSSPVRGAIFIFWKIYKWLTPFFLQKNELLRQLMSFIVLIIYLF